MTIAEAKQKLVAWATSQIGYAETGGDVVYLNIGYGASAPTFLSLEPQKESAMKFAIFAIIIVAFLWYCALTAR